MARAKKNSSLLAKYSMMYEKKPRSRVFAPLAETYRKIGMIDDALKILKEGIKHHPTYTLGYIVLANCYYDMQNYEMAYTTIRPFVAKNLENIRLQKLFAKTCINLSHLEEALQTFKYLLLLNPNDSYVADQIKILEDDLLIHEEDENPITEELEQVQKDFDDFNENEWVEVSFNKKYEKVDEQLDNWDVKKNESPLEQFKEELKTAEITVKEHKLDDEYYHEDYDNQSEDVIDANEDNLVEFKQSEKPIITHTLVDLYLKQNHYDKAIEILENILEIHPHDKVTQDKLVEIKAKASGEIELKEDIQDDRIKNLEIIFSKFQSSLNEKSKTVLQEL